MSHNVCINGSSFAGNNHAIWNVTVTDNQSGEQSSFVVREGNYKVAYEKCLRELRLISKGVVYGKAFSIATVAKTWHLLSSDNTHRELTQEYIQSLR